MDAGSNDGTTTERLCAKFPDRKVVSVEPLRTNVERILRRVERKNVTVVQGLLSSSLGWGRYPSYLDGRLAGKQTQTGELYAHRMRHERSWTDVPVYTVDSLCKHVPLALAHWDVEGSEWEVLRGARGTLARDRPIFTVETFPLSNATRHARLVHEVVHELGYAMHLVDEVCGSPKDCRNLVAVPKERYDASRMPPVCGPALNE